MAWKKVSPEMCDLLEDALAGYVCEKRKMFGCPAYFINNNMFAGVHGDFILLRLSEADRDEVKAKYDEVGQFEPFEGRPMKEYIGFPDWLSSDRQEFMDWLSRSYEFANKLPPKVKKPKKKKKAKH